MNESNTLSYDPIYAAFLRGEIEDLSGFGEEELAAYYYAEAA